MPISNDLEAIAARLRAEEAANEQYRIGVETILNVADRLLADGTAPEAVLEAVLKNLRGVCEP